MNVITRELRDEILELLYKDEALNLSLIQRVEECGEMENLYIGYRDGRVSEILNINADGNSRFTSFYYKDSKGLDKIIGLLSNMTDARILVEGRDNDVQAILDGLRMRVPLYSNHYYIHDIETRSPEVSDSCKLVPVDLDNKDDIGTIKTMMKDFFGGEEDVDSGDNDADAILKDKINKGYYILSVDDEQVGMARYYARSKKYIGVTSLYIREEYRGKGYGKQLMSMMIEKARAEGKTPVTQVALDNTQSRAVVEGLGFQKVHPYAFQFIS